MSTPAQETFNEHLVESLRKSPWLLLSVLFHAGILLLLSQIDFQVRPPVVGGEIEAVLIPEELLTDFEKDPVVEEEEVEPVEEPEPVLTEPPVEKALTEDDPTPSQEEETGDFDDAYGDLLVIGPGDGSSGAFGPGFRGRGRSGIPKRAQNAIDWGLDWLARHQSEDGSWGSSDFHYHCEDAICDGPGLAGYDTGVTGLALLTFLGAGQTHNHGKHKDTVKRGLGWLRHRQDPEGCFGSRARTNFIYGHAISTLAMVEAYGMTGSPYLRQPAQRGIDFIHECKNPTRAWRYGVRPGDNDVSVTGWMVMAMKSAKGAGLRVIEGDFRTVRDFMDEMTDAFGRVGYLSRGTPPVRPIGREEEFPAEESESLTAVGVLSRIFMGEDPKRSEPIQNGARLCAARPPRWEPSKLDFYYWYYGTLALFQVGGPHWESWNQAMKKAILDKQERSGCERGSWDPIDAWGEEGGRVYSTSLLTMCLEVYYRYPRVFGGARE